MPDDKPSHQDAACPGVKRRRLHVAAAAALAVLAIAAITPVWNSDIFSHPACGRWMFDNGQVLSVDPFTAEPEDPGAEWVNVHWGFQIIVAALHAVGGFALLSIFKAALACALASGWLYRWRGSPDRFAVGLRRQAYLIGPAKYLRDLDAEGNILCQDFGDAGVESQRQVWYRANPPSPHADLGGMFLALGRLPARTQQRAWEPLAGRCALLAIRYLTAAADHQRPRDRTAGMLAQAHWQWAARCRQAVSPAVPIDTHFAKALRLYRRIDLANVDAKYVWAFALARMGAMVQAGHFDAAQRELDALLDVLPARARVNPPKEYRRPRETLAAKTDDVERMLAGDDFQAADLLGRVRLLARTRIGMTDRAIAELQAYPQPTTDTRIALGDLLLRQGRPDEAVQEGVQTHLPRAGQAMAGPVETRPVRLGGRRSARGGGHAARPRRLVRPTARAILPGHAGGPTRALRPGRRRTCRHARRRTAIDNRDRSRQRAPPKALTDTPFTFGQSCSPNR